MRNRHRTAVFDLTAEQRNDTSVASQYISKAHCRKLCRAVSSDQLNHHLTEPLARSHDVGRVDCLVLEAGAYAKNGQIFVLNMGDPVRIADLAKI